MSANLFDRLREPEVMSLREKCHEITGKWPAYHWDCFGNIDEYKEHMKKIIEEHEHSAAGQ